MVADADGVSQIAVMVSCSCIVLSTRAMLTAAAAVRSDSVGCARRTGNE